MVEKVFMLFISLTALHIDALLVYGTVSSHVDIHSSFSTSTTLSERNPFKEDVIFLLFEMDPAAKIELEAMKDLESINEATEPGDSEVQQFYHDSVVFITGGTGFIGKQLLEKLFRSCGLKKAFLLIRTKRGKPAKQRLLDMLNDPVFGPVCLKKPDMVSRIVCVEGDITEPQLGICIDDWNMIKKEIEVIFHVAATVKFDENIRKATEINVGGTREVIKLGKACTKLKSFVHVSTAYSPATTDRVKGEVLEQFYKSPMPAETLMTFVENIDERQLEEMTQNLISGWPNTYTFTKAVAEELIQAESGNFPVCIVRPSIVTNTYREPLPGWVDESCVHAPSGLPIGVILGLVRVFFIDNTVKLSIVPVDLVNNAIIAAGWLTGLRGLKEPKIYNICVTRNEVTFKHFSSMVNSLSHEVPSPKALWYCYLIETKNRRVYKFLSWILHYIPAYIADAVLDVTGVKKRQGLKSIVYQYSKFDRLSDVLSHFTINEWNFDDTNLQNLWQKMSNNDKTIYNFDIDSIDWNHKAVMWFIGTRKYFIKDGLKGTELAVARQRWLRVANIAVFFGYLTVLRMFLSRLWWLVKLLQKTFTNLKFRTSLL